MTEIKNKNDIENSVYDLCQILQSEIADDTTKNRVIEILEKHLNSYFNEQRKLEEKNQYSSIYYNPLFPIIKTILKSLVKTYLNTKHQYTKELIHHLLFLILEKQTKIKNNQIGLSLLISNFQKKLFDYELKQTKINENNLVQICLTIHAEITHSEPSIFENTENQIQIEYLKFLNLNFFSLLKMLIDNNLDDFTFKEIFDEDIYKYQFFKHYSFFARNYEDIIIAGENIYPNYWEDHDGFKKLRELAGSINPFNISEEIIQKTVNDLKVFYERKENVDNDQLGLLLSNVRNKLISEYNHKLMSQCVFEFLAYCYSKKKYTIVSEIINYRYAHPIDTSIPIFIPNHHFRNIQQQELFLFLAFNYFEETAFESYKKPDYLINFTIVYLIYCLEQKDYHRWVDTYNCWDTSINDSENLKEVLNSVEVKKQSGLYVELKNKIQRYISHIEDILQDLQYEKSLEDHIHFTKDSFKLYQIIKDPKIYGEKSNDLPKFKSGLEQAKNFFEQLK